MINVIFGWISSLSLTLLHSMHFFVSILPPLFLLLREVPGFSCLPIFGGGSSPCGLSSLMNPRQGLDIQLAQLFRIERTWATTSKLLTCQSRNGTFWVVPLFTQNVLSLPTQCSPCWTHLVPRCHIAFPSDGRNAVFSLLNWPVFGGIKQSSAKLKTRRKERPYHDISQCRTT